MSERRSSVDPARRAAYEVLRRCFEHGAWADRAFPAAAERHGLRGDERARGQWLAFGAVQRRGTSDHFAQRLAGRTPNRIDPPVAAALRLGCFELLFGGEPAAHAVVHDAVELAKGGMSRGGARRARGAAGLVNAVLRRIASERDALLASLDDSTPAGAAVAHSAPEWLAAMWWEELGQDAARALLAAANRPPETALRVNTLRAHPQALRERLERAGERVLVRSDGAGPLWPAEALVVAGRLGPEARAALAAGELLAQSRGAQAAVELLCPQPGDRVLDVCAGPGLKTVAIAARVGADGTVEAVERDAGRARQLAELCARTGARNVAVRQADAAELELDGGYDRVLVDPPCSDLGTLASRPDARWRKQPRTIARLAALQARILDRAAAALRPGGTLLYSTCTISRRESEDVVLSVLGDRRALAADRLAVAPRLVSPHDERFLQVRPDRDGTDGFFYARLRRAS